jgi:hypothetical protein
MNESMNEFRQIYISCGWQQIEEASIPNMQHVPNSMQITSTKGYQAQVSRSDHA